MTYEKTYNEIYLTPTDIKLTIHELGIIIGGLSDRCDYWRDKALKENDAYEREICNRIADETISLFWKISNIIQEKTTE